MEDVEQVTWNEKKEIVASSDTSLGYRRRHYLDLLDCASVDLSQRKNYFEDIARHATNINDLPKKKALLTSYLSPEEAEQKRLRTSLKAEKAIRILEEPVLYKPPKRRLKIAKFSDDSVDDMLPITVYSDTGSRAGLTPDNFQFHEYPAAYEIGSVNKQHENLIVNCDCEGINCGDNCPCHQFSELSKTFYMGDGRVIFGTSHHSHNSLVVTCGELCSCSHDCMMRIENMKFPHMLEVFRRNNSIGFGVRTLSPIRVGEVICEFKGVVKLKEDLVMEQAEYAFAIEEKEDMHLIRLLREWTDKFFFDSASSWDRYQPENVVIDPYEMGNIGRFLLHGCFPNTKMMRLTGNYLVPRRHRMFLVAMLPIPAGMELTFDYGNEYLEQSEFDCLCATLTCRTNRRLWHRLFAGQRQKVMVEYMRKLRGLTQKQIKDMHDRLDPNKVVTVDDSSSSSSESETEDSSSGEEDETVENGCTNQGKGGAAAVISNSTITVSSDSDSDSEHEEDEDDEDSQPSYDGMRSRMASDDDSEPEEVVTRYERRSRSRTPAARSRSRSRTPIGWDYEARDRRRY